MLPNDIFSFIGVIFTWSIITDIACKVNSYHAISDHTQSAECYLKCSCPVSTGQRWILKARQQCLRYTQTHIYTDRHSPGWRDSSVYITHRHTSTLIDTARDGETAVSTLHTDRLIYTVHCEPLLFWLYLCEMLSDSENSFTVERQKEFPTKSMYWFPPHFRYAAARPSGNLDCLTCHYYSKHSASSLLTDYLLTY